MDQDRNLGIWYLHGYVMDSLWYLISAECRSLILTF